MSVALRRIAPYVLVAALFVPAVLCCNAPPAAAWQEHAQQQSWPIVPFIAEFQPTAQYLMEWIKDSEYSMIELTVSKGSPPDYQAVLTETRSSRHVYYCTSESRVKYLTAKGREARLAKMDFHSDGSTGRTTITLGFKDERRQAIRWRFIAATEPSEQGAGLTPQNGGSGIVVTYRELATAAGEGSAVQIGERVSEADPWPEISSPPYFVAYRGSYVEGMPIGALLAGSEHWQVTKSPDSLSLGAEWVMAAGDRKRQLRIASVKGDEFVIAEALPGDALGGALTLVAHRTASGLAIRSASIGGEGRSMRVSFNPELNLFPTSQNGQAAQIAFQIDQDKHSRLITGKIAMERSDGSVRLHWQPESPSWAKARTMTTTICFDSDGYRISTQ